MDADGEFWDTILDLLSLGLSVKEVIENPDDVRAWVGLAGDVFDVLVPFVGGIGEITRAVSVTSKLVDTADDVHDTGKLVDAVSPGWHVGDDITKLTKAGNEPSWSTVC